MKRRDEARNLYLGILWCGWASIMLWAGPALVIVLRPEVLS